MFRVNYQKNSQTLDISSTVQQLYLEAESLSKDLPSLIISLKECDFNKEACTVAKVISKFKNPFCRWGVRSGLPAYEELIESRKSWYYFSIDARIGSKYSYGVSALCKYINSSLRFTYSLDFNLTSEYIDSNKATLIFTLNLMKEKLDKIIQGSQRSAFLSEDLSIFLILKRICESVYLELLGKDS